MRVHFIPATLEHEVLYYSEEFGIATHLCPCGCGHKIQTPIGPSDYSLSVENNGPTLFPSIGNWQKPCRSHYWIRGGEIIWDRPWSEAQVVAGRATEAARNQLYFESITSSRRGLWQILLRWLRGK